MQGVSRGVVCVITNVEKLKVKLLTSKRGIISGSLQSNAFDVHPNIIPIIKNFGKCECITTTPATNFKNFGVLGKGCILSQQATDSPTDEYERLSSDVLANTVRTHSD